MIPGTFIFHRIQVNSPSIPQPLSHEKKQLKVRWDGAVTKWDGINLGHKDQFRSVKKHKISKDMHLVGGFNLSEQYEFVIWDDEIPNIWKKKNGPVTTNQFNSKITPFPGLTSGEICRMPRGALFKDCLILGEGHFHHRLGELLRSRRRVVD